MKKQLLFYVFSGLIILSTTFIVSGLNLMITDSEVNLNDSLSSLLVSYDFNSTVNKPDLIDCITNNLEWISAILLFIYELIVRRLSSKKNWSFVSLLSTIVDKLIPNVSKSNVTGRKGLFINRKSIL